MKLARRDLLKTVTLGSSASVLASCERITNAINQNLLGEGVPAHLHPAESVDIDPDFHLLSRASFGPWPGDVASLKKKGRDAWIEEQLHPDSISDTACDLRAERFESLYFSAGDAYEFRKPVLREELTRHALLRAVYSRRQLFEVMVEFWTDHLNIDLEKGDCIYLKPSDDRDVIRQHALGNFRDLIRASATSPAMLVYLDGKTNKVRRGTTDQPNENYARELMELHTLGVHGGYTQKDVYEAARCLSGWTFDPKRVFALNQGESYFRPDWHDDGTKEVLGQTLPAGGGPKDLDRLVDIVCKHPATAQYIALKLCRRFVSPTPPASLLQTVAAEFTRTQGDICSLLRVIFKSDEFFASRGQLLKRPFKFMVSALRAVAADTQADQSILEPLQRMGHGLFQYPTPDGYPDEELPWMGTLMWRWNFALALAANKQLGAKVNLHPLHKALREPGTKAELGRWFGHLIGRQPTGAELATLTQFSPDSSASAIGLILASPAFQRC
ncbi:DUF1800 domain-containing protein [Prosthecobacter dejongeii]|uniref:Uncharacterized protein (DUF1800 family) n=1 Tax=Prosthecobacter dejongeii TaxID=48465 RepID=A0A7W7YHA5_9BACT|nr:DUF1800 domain-containing protein [Prosthecobacter dejongeii]MBB5036114.1 uncharacterized protein (DUF1800 family) [Prosthecobacter dejongeii]